MVETKIMVAIVILDNAVVMARKYLKSEML